MPNRIYNKQVTPKGYKMGGRAKKMGGGMMMMERPMMKEGGPSKKPKVKKILRTLWIRRKKRKLN